MANAINEKHPLYTELLPDWETMYDTYKGERYVKKAGIKYLFPTSGMIADGMGLNQLGWKAYCAYRSRAIFHDFVREGVEYYVGLLHQKPPQIDLPKQLEPMRTDATINHETLEQLLRKINEQQLVTGRWGGMLDIPQNPDPQHLVPYVASYDAKTILNWDVGSREDIDLPELNLVVLNESRYVRQNFSWKYQEQYRVLTLGPVGTNEPKGAIYKQGLFSGANVTFDESKLEPPNIRGNTLDEIPFVFVNAQDMLPQPDVCPLLGLANLALAIYRGEADYRQNLFMQGQDTLVIIGGNDKDETVRAGAGSVIQLSARAGADAKYIGVTSTGLSEQREGLENDKAQARNKSGQLIDTRSNQKESGQALQTRVAAQAATLNAIAKTGAAGLEKLLKLAAIWVGADPEEVKVTPNTDFTDEKLPPADLVQLQTAKTLGAPIAEETIHDLMKQRGLTKLSYQEEMDRIAEEAPVMGTGTTAGGNPVLDPGTGKPMIDPKTGKPMTQPGGSAEDPGVVLKRTEQTAKANSAGKPPPKGFKK